MKRSRRSAPAVAPKAAKKKVTKKTAKKKVTKKTAKRVKSTIIEAIYKGMTPKARRSSDEIDDDGEAKPAERRRVGVMGDDQEFLADPTEWISTGIPTLDKLFGGGLPVGRVVELVGPEASGKTALSQLIMSQCQAKKGIICYIDAERACDRGRMRQVGCDLDRVIYCKPRYMEEASSMIQRFLSQVRSKDLDGPALVVFDSLAACPPKAEYEAREDDVEGMAAIHAARISSMCRKLYDAIDGSRAVALLVNQERETIGGPRGGFKMPVSPGGRHVKYAASLRIRCTHSQIRQGDVVTGYRIHVNTLKSRLVPPHRKCDWVLDFELGPDVARSVFETLQACKVLKKGVGGFKHKADPRGDVVCESLDDFREKWKNKAFRTRVAGWVKELPPNMNVGMKRTAKSRESD